MSAGAWQRASVLHVLVPVDDADEARAGRVRGLGHSACDRSLFDVVGEDDHVLTGLDAHAHAYGQLGEALDSRVHARNPIMGDDGALPRTGLRKR